MDREREPLPTRVRDTLDLPAAYDHAVQRGLDQLGLDVGPDARATIKGHVRLLLAWTSAINLTGIRDPAAVGMAHGPAAGLAALTRLGEEPALAAYGYLPAARAAFLVQLGRRDEARAAYAEALLLTENTVERRWLAERLEQLDAP